MTHEVVSLENVKVGDIVQAADGTRYRIISTDSKSFFGDVYIIKGNEIKVDNTLDSYNRYWNVDGFHINYSPLNIVSIEHNRKFKVGDRFEYTSGLGAVYEIISIVNDSDYPYIIKGVNRGSTDLIFNVVQMMNDEMVDLNGCELKTHNDDPLGFKTAKVGDVYINRDGDELYFVAINPYMKCSPVYLHNMSSLGTCTYKMDGRFGATRSKWDVVRKKEVSNDSSK